MLTPSETRAREAREPTNGFRTIVADPPWEPSLHRNTVGRREGPYRAGPQRYYPVMTVDEICALCVPSARKAHLYLWVINQHVDWGYRVARAWGFEPQQMLTWAKSGFGTGQFQSNSESILVCRKGGPVANAFGKTRGTWFQWSRGRHSQKPHEFFALVERVSPGPYLEMFARSDRAGWSNWGLEAPLGTSLFETVDRRSLPSLPASLESQKEGAADSASVKERV